MSGEHRARAVLLVAKQRAECRFGNHVYGAWFSAGREHCMYCPHSEDIANILADPLGTYLDDPECPHPATLRDEWGNVMCVHCNDEWWEDPL